MTDVVRAGQTPVSAVVSDEAVTIAAEASLAEAGRVLVEAEVGLVVVGEPGGRPTGVVSERDIVRAVAEGRDPGTTRVGDVAHTDLAWCDATATVAEVADEMMNHWVRHLLVEEEGRFLGVVSARDLLGVYVSADQADEGSE
ncbi:MAG: CBS domain-containing protein [Acidobacteriota bacterium]|nr:CBS domain-containing protein [Acidobacteriota bacterium]